MNCVEIEKKDNYVYIRCKKCNQVLITNDPSYSLASINNKQFIVISSCEHFEVSEIDNNIEIVSR